MSNKIKKQKGMIKNTYIILFFIILYAMVIRTTPDVIERDFWHDEAFTYEYAQMPVSYIMDSTDVHPPLFTLFAKLLIQGLKITDIFVLRTIMVLISMLFMLSIFYTTLKIFKNYKVGLVALAIITISPTYIHYSTEFRSYILTLLVVVWQIYYFYKFNQNIPIKANKYDGFKFILLSVLMVSLHYLTALILFMQVLYTLHKRKYKHFVEYSLIFVMLMPTIIYAIRTIPKIQSFWFKDIDLVSLVSTFAYMFSPPMKLTGIWTLILLFGFYAIFKNWINFGFRGGYLMLGYAIVPVIVMWMVSQIFPFYHHRYFIFGGTYLIIALAWGYTLNSYYTKDFEQIVYALCIMFLVLGLPAYYSTLNYELSESAQALKDDISSAECSVIHESPFSQTPYKVYLPDCEHYLFTTLTNAELFTAGGSVITNKHTDTIEAMMYDNVYYVTDNPKFDKELIYNKGGLWLYKLK